MKRKLQNSQGETLVEMLASILIASLSVALLFGGIMAAGSIDHSARKADAAYYAALSGAEAQTAPLSLPGLTATVTNTAGGAAQQVEISAYGENGLYSYGRSPAGATP